jgi:hypothetical protein
LRYRVIQRFIFFWSEILAPRKTIDLGLARRLEGKITAHRETSLILSALAKMIPTPSSCSEANDLNGGFPYSDSHSASTMSLSKVQIISLVKNP